jgi:glycosyltransferase 2 family protein
VPKRWRVILQLALAAVVVAYVGRSVAQNWNSYRSLRIALELRPGWLAISFGSLAVVSALQIESWRIILRGWAQRLRFLAAARIWFLANLGRYVPGKVWSVAGMVVLAEQEGVARWASAAAAVAVQAIGIGTAAVLVTAATPHAYSALQMAAALILAAGTVGMLGWKGALPRIGRMVGASAEWRALPLGAVLGGSAVTLLGWCVYGFAFWALGRGLGLPAALPLPQAAGVFALGYIVGLLALFAPGGLGPREFMFQALLTPYLGVGGAAALTIASRLQLTLTEAAAGLGALTLVRRRGKGREPLDART